MLGNLQFDGNVSLELRFEVAVGTLHCIPLTSEPDCHLSQEKVNLDILIGVEWLCQLLVEAGPHLVNCC